MVCPADTFFRKIQEQSIISSEIHHELLKKEDRNKINPMRSTPVTPARKQNGEGQFTTTAASFSGSGMEKGAPGKSGQERIEHPVYTRCCHEVSIGP